MKITIVDGQIHVEGKPKDEGEGPIAQIEIRKRPCVTQLFVTAKMPDVDRVTPWTFRDRPRVAIHSNGSTPDFSE